MFEIPDRAALTEMSDETLISAVTDATRAEAMAAAHRLALIAEVVARECDDEDDGIAHAVIDGWAWAKAPIPAACNLNSHAASKQMRIAKALRTRLPRTAALFAQGAVSATVIDAITWRTHLVEDPDALALIDAVIGGEATDYSTRSEKKASSTPSTSGWRNSTRSRWCAPGGPPKTSTSSSTTRTIPTHHRRTTTQRHCTRP